MLPFFSSFCECDRSVGTLADDEFLKWESLERTLKSIMVLTELFKMFEGVGYKTQSCIYRICNYCYVCLF